MKKRNITVIRNCQVYLNKNDIIEEWLEPGSMKSVEMKVMSGVKMPDAFGYYTNEFGFLFKNELQAEVVEDIFSACLWSIPVERICQRLNAMSCVTPNGYDEWTPELIEMIIHNEIYAGYKFIEEDGISIGVYTDEDGNEYKVYNKCPHLGCSLEFNEVEKTWDCPCHGSRFDLDGNVITEELNLKVDSLYSNSKLFY